MQRTVMSCVDKITGRKLFFFAFVSVVCLFSRDHIVFGRVAFIVTFERVFLTVV